MSPIARRSRSRRALAWAVAVLLVTLAFGTVHRFRGWDQTFYLAQTSSLVEDGDLDLRNDVLHGGRSLERQIRLLTTVRPNGALFNTFPVGPSLLWTPAYALSIPLRSALAEVPGLRWSPPQLAALHLLNLGLLLALLWSLDRWLRRFGAPRRFAAAATLALVLGSALLVYGFRQYTTSHLATVLAVTWLLAAALRLEARPTIGNALLCGLALGAVFLFRWQDVLKGVVLLIPLWRLRARGVPLRRLAILAGSAAAGALLVASLQLHAWVLEWGRWLGLPQGEGYVRWADPELGRFLLSGLSGLVPWSPVFVVGLVGLCLPWRSRPPRIWALAALALVLVDVYVNAAVVDWWGGTAYGSRRMISSLPLLAVGLANLGIGSRRRRPATLLLLLCCLWGVFTGHLYVRGIRDLSPVFAGRASDAPGAEREGGLEKTPEEAREIARELPVRYRGITYFPSLRDKARGLGRVATILLMAGFLWLAAAALARARSDRILAVALAAMLTLVLLGHLRLAAGSRPDPVERHLWGDLSRRVQRPTGDVSDLEARVARAFADPGDRFADPRRYVWAWALHQAGRTEEAGSVAAGLEGRPYPSVEDLRAAVSVAPGLRLLESLPGAFFRTEDAERQWIAVPARLDLSRTDVTIRFGLRLDREPTGARVILVWRLPERNRPDGRPLAVLVVTEACEIRLATPDGEASLPFEVTVGEVTAVTLEWLHAQRRLRLTLDRDGTEPRRLAVPLVVEPGKVWRWFLIFGRPSGWEPDEALEAAVGSDLRVTATR